MTEHDNIRQTGLEQFIGKRLLDITQRDADEMQREGGLQCIVLMFEEGGSITIPITELGLSFDDGNDQPQREDTDG